MSEMFKQLERDEFAVFNSNMLDHIPCDQIEMFGSHFNFKLHSIHGGVKKQVQDLLAHRVWDLYKLGTIGKWVTCDPIVLNCKEYYIVLTVYNVNPDKINMGFVQKADPTIPTVVLLNALDVNLAKG